MGSENINPSDVDDQAPIQFRSPEGPWKFAQILDWITIYPDIDHTAYRVYATFVAVTTKESRFRRRLTLDQMRWLVPGVNGKPMKYGAFRNALKTLDRLGLVRVAQSSGKEVQHRDATTGRYQTQESVIFEIGNMPEDLATFDGWRNVYEKLDDYPGIGWDSPRAVNDAATERRVQNSEHGSDQGDDRPDAGHRHVQNSDGGVQNSDGGVQNSERTEPVPRENEVPPYSPSTQFFHNQPTSAQAADGSTPAAAEPDSAGWLAEDAPQDETDQQGHGESVGARLLRSLRAADGTSLNAEAVASYTTTIDALLATGHGEQQITEHVTTGMRGAGGIRSKLAKLADGSETVPVPQSFSPRSTRADDRAATQRQQDTADAKAADQPTQQPAPWQQGPVVSPVDWLTDVEYAALSPQDKAAVRIAAETPVEQMAGVPARRVQAIINTRTAAV